MYCNICGNRKENISILRIIMCKDCFDEIANISILDDDYDKYKDIVKNLLSLYISPKAILNPAE